MAIYNYDKVFIRKNPGAAIAEYVRQDKIGAIDTNTIRKIVCSYTNNLNACQYREIMHGGGRTPSKVIIDEVQYNQLVALVNPA